jgi:hypothetical protein
MMTPPAAIVFRGPYTSVSHPIIIEAIPYARNSTENIPDNIALELDNSESHALKKTPNE